ncbi:MAG: TldD/PmbA family protein, partial [Cyanobacteria bacterium P01_E01_bin.43]
MSRSFDDYTDQIIDLVARYRDRVDFLAIRLEESEGTDILLRGGKVETLSEGIDLGGQVRACHRGGWGFASFNHLAGLVEHIEGAILAARLVGDDETLLAQLNPIQTQYRFAMTGSSPREISLTRKKALCAHYDDILQSVDDRIATTSVRYNDATQHILLVTSEGTQIEQSWSDMEIRLAATARNGETVQTGRETNGSRQAFEDLENLDGQVHSAAERAIAALDLPPVKGNTYEVVIDPILTGLFVHEAFGHLSEADMAYENPDLLEVMTLGRRFGPKNLQIYDGAALAGHRGSYQYDDEGCPATTTQLIEDGVLVGRLH